MPAVLFATNFLAGSLLTLLMPTGLLIVIAVWYVRLVKRVPEDVPASSASLPSPEVVASARPATEDAAGQPPPTGP